MVSSKRFTFVLILFFLCVLILSCKHGGSDKIEKVVLISIDTLRADYLGCYDPAKRISPNIDRFAAENILFEDATSQAPSTAISHKSILYSLYPAVHKVTRDTLPTETEPSPLEILQSKGFKTAGFVGGGQVSRKFGFARGFDTYWEASQGTPKAGNDQDNLREIETHATEWLDRNYQEKFFLFVHTYEVHCPYNPPDEYARRFTGWYHGSLDPVGKCGDNYYNLQPMSAEDVQYVRGLYSGSINFVDDAIGRLMKKLKDLNIYDQTMIVFLSDHGESLGERSYVGHGQPFEIQLRIPMVMHVPGLDRVRIAQPVIALDVMPTIFDALGFARAYPFQGRTLVSVLKGTNKIEPDRVLIAEQKDRVRVRKGNWSCIFSNNGPHRKELFNLQIDPKQLNNLAEEHPKKVHELMHYYTQMINSSRQISAKFVLNPGNAPDLDEATNEQLKALGYVGN